MKPLERVANAAEAVDHDICRALDLGPDDMSVEMRRNLLAWHERLSSALSATTDPRMARILDRKAQEAT